MLRIFPHSKTLRISPYSIRMRENTDQKKLRIRTFFTPCHGVGIITFKTPRRIKRVSESPICHCMIQLGKKPEPSMFIGQLYSNQI